MIKCDSSDFIGAFNFLLEKYGSQIILYYLNEVFGKLINIIKSIKSSYLSKLESCISLRILSNKLDEKDDIFIQIIYDKVIDALNIATKDRIHKVQNAAMLAKENWEKRFGEKFKNRSNSY